jgi:uncharacterized alpha/beta hydrolase family protein
MKMKIFIVILIILIILIFFGIFILSEKIENDKDERIEKQIEDIRLKK